MKAMNEKINTLKERLENFRDRVQSGEKKSNKWKKRWQKYSSKLYLFMGLLTMVGYCFVAFSRNFFEDDSPLKDSGIGQANVTKIGSSEVTVLSREVNEKTGYAEIFLHVDDGKDLVNKEYVVFAGEVSKQKTVKAKLVPLIENYYLVQLTNIPEKWQLLAIDFGYNAEKKAPTSVNQVDDKQAKTVKNNSQQATLYWDVRKSKTNEKLTEKPKENYLIYVISEEEKETKGRQAKLATSQEEIEEEVNKIYDKIDQYSEEIQYKVGKEKEETQEEIDRLKRDVEKYDKASDEIKNEQKLMAEKLKKLAEKKQSIEKNNKDSSK